MDEKQSYQRIPQEQTVPRKRSNYWILLITVGILLIFIGALFVLFFVDNDSSTDEPPFIDVKGNLLTKKELLQRDRDGDGLSDYEELATFQTDWRESDTDKDGISDGEEVNRETDPVDNLKNIDSSDAPLPTFGTSQVSVSSKCEDNLTVGDEVSFQGGVFQRGAEVVITLVTGDEILTGERPDYVIGIVTADANGRVDVAFTIPKDFEIGYFSEEHNVGTNFTLAGVEAVGKGEDGREVLIVDILGMVTRSCMTKEEFESSNLEYAKKASEVDRAQYNAKTIKAIKNLPFAVYKATYVPEGYQMSKYKLKNFYGQDLDEVAVESAIHKKGSEFLSQLGAVLASHFIEETWVTMTQVKLSVSLNPNCPSGNPGVQQTNGGFFHDCEPLGTLTTGETVYWSKSNQDFRPKTISVLKGETLIVLDKVGYSSLSEEEQDEVMKVLESLEVLSTEEFLEQL